MYIQHLNKISTPILLIVSIIVIICSYYDILGYHLFSAIYLTIFMIVMLKQGWSIGIYNNPQSFVYLVHNNVIEFVLRTILLFTTLYVGLFINGSLTFYYGPLIIITVLCCHLTIDSGEYSLLGLWNSNKLIFSIVFVCILAYFVLLYF